MKVFDIINEDRNSGFINTFLKGIAWMLGRGPRAKAIEELSGAWLAKMMEAGTPNVSMPINVIRDPVLAADREIMDKAQKIAIKGFRKAEQAGLIRDIGIGAGKVGKGITSVINAIKNLLVSAGFIATGFQVKFQIDEYEVRFKNEQVRLENGEITEEQYLRRIGAIRATLVTQLAIVIGLSTATAFLAGIKKVITLGVWGPRVGFFKSSFALLNSAGQLYVANQLLKEEKFRKDFVEFLLADDALSKFITGVAAADHENSPFFQRYKQVQKAAEELTGTDSPTPQQSTGSGQRTDSTPAPTQSGKPPVEKSSGIDWSTVK